MASDMCSLVPLSHHPCYLPFIFWALADSGSQWQPEHYEIMIRPVISKILLGGKLLGQHLSLCCGISSF